MKKQLKDYMWIAFALAVILVLIAIFNEATIRSALNGILGWVASSMGLTPPVLF